MSAPLRPGVPGLTSFLGIDIVYYSQAEIDGDARAQIIDPALLSYHTAPGRLMVLTSPLYQRAKTCQLSMPPPQVYRLATALSAAVQDNMPC
jgi:hypothetical protein